MRRLYIVFALVVLAAPSLLADTQDTAVFRTRMLPDNEVPPVSAAGNSASGTITVHVVRNFAGNITDATVIFDVDYTLTSAQTFNGLHIHNAPAGQNGAIVIDTGISATSPVTVSAVGSGRITRVVNYGSSDTNGLRFVTGLLAVPENYYVNIHSTANADGLMRGQLLPNRLVFRPIMSPLNEVPAITGLDAEGAATVEVQVTRDPQTAAITSGTVQFDVDYRFPSAVTIVGLHLHNGPAGVNAPAIIDSGINANTRAISNVTRGNIFRIAEIDSSNPTLLAALTALIADPTQFYINLHTTVNPNGAIRGQLSRNAFVFFNLMTQAEEVPPTGVSGTGNSMTYVRVDRDSTGNITNGEVSFNLNYNFGSPQTFIGFHIHNGRLGQNDNVVISTGIGGSNPVVSQTGFGSINIEVPITPSNTAAFNALRGLLENPENYYVNIHTPQFPGGIIRAQLVRETYHFKANMSPANEVPPITTVDTAATGWITAKMSRDAAGNINGGSVTFDVNFTNTGSITFTGLHIHHPGTAGVNANVVISSGIGGSSPVESTTGSGNITRVGDAPTTAAGTAALNCLITSPDNCYVNLHTTQFGGGVVRSQMFPLINTVAQVAGGADWTTVITVRNTSNSAVQGILDLFQPNGSPFPEVVSDPFISFLVPPQGSLSFATHNRTALATGFAKIFSNGNLTVEMRYLHPAFTSTTGVISTTTARSVSLPVSVGRTATTNTGVALIANAAGTLNLSLRDASGNAIAGGSRTIDVTAGQQIALFVRELLPGVTATQFTGTLTITTSAGTISILALQFDGTMTPVTITTLP